MAARILIVEDEKKMAQFMETELKHEGYAAVTANDGREGLSLILSGRFDLVLLDVLLPGLNGVEVLRRVRQSLDLPVILVTVKSDIPDRVMGLDTGANDYIVKPFAIEELLARVRNQLRGLTKLGEEVLTLGSLAMNTRNHEVSRDGEVIQLTKKEYDILEMLIRNKGIVLTRDRLLESLWGYEYAGDTNVVDVFIKHLRTKLDVAGQGSYITTVRGVGYAVKEAAALSLFPEENGGEKEG